MAFPAEAETEVRVEAGRTEGSLPPCHPVTYEAPGTCSGF